MAGHSAAERAADAHLEPDHAAMSVGYVDPHITASLKNTSARVEYSLNPGRQQYCNSHEI